MCGKPRACAEWLSLTDKLTLKELERDGKFESVSMKITKWILDMVRSGKGKGLLAEKIVPLEEEYDKRQTLNWSHTA